MEINVKSVSDLLICESLNQCAYRITNRANATPIITIRNVPSVPPTITEILSDKKAVWR